MKQCHRQHANCITECETNLTKKTINANIDYLTAVAIGDGKHPSIPILLLPKITNKYISITASVLAIFLC